MYRASMISWDVTPWPFWAALSGAGMAFCFVAWITSIMVPEPDLTTPSGRTANALTNVGAYGFFFLGLGGPVLMILMACFVFHPYEVMHSITQAFEKDGQPWPTDVACPQLWKDPLFIPVF